MIHINAAQHIYGNVEEEQSPNKIGGFQTLFYTKSMISEEEAHDIEGKSIYYQSSINPVKWNYFRLSTSKIALGRIIPLGDKDKFGREGTYLAHTFVLTVEDFHKVQGLPFIIFDAVENGFFNSVTEALAAGNCQTGDIDSIPINLSETEVAEKQRMEIEEAGTWNLESLKLLSFYAIQDRSFKRDSIPLAFIGTSEHMLATLNMIFSFIPESLRLNFSFDSHYFGCSVVHCEFAVIGYTRNVEPSGHLTVIDTEQKKVTSKSSLPQEVSPYLQWLFDKISNSEFEEIVSSREVAYRWDRFFLGKPCDEILLKETLETYSYDTINDIAKAFQPWLKETVFEKLETVAGPALAVHITERLHSQAVTHQEFGRLFHRILSGFDLNQLANECYEIFGEFVTQVPGKKEMEELRILLDKIPNPQLEMLVLLWSADYHSLLEYLTNETSRFDTFIPMLDQMDLKQLKGIRKIVDKKREQYPVSFLEKLDNSIALLNVLSEGKESGGFFKKLLSRFH